MWRFRKRDRDELDLERELRANRPEPSADFVKSLAAEIRESSAPAPARRVRASRRLAFRLRFAPALGLMILCLVAAGAFGGAAIATGGGKHSDKKGEHQNGKDENDDGDDDDADEDQYDKKVVICHHPNGNDPHTIRVSKKAAAKHIANHGDTLGPCANNGGGGDGNDDDDDDDDDDGKGKGKNGKDDDDKNKGKNGKNDDDDKNKGKNGKNDDDDKNKGKNGKSGDDD